MDRQDDDPHADWSPGDVQWDGLALTARNTSGAGADANVPTIEKYYIKGRGAASSGSSSGLSSSTCRVPGCTSDLSRDLAYFRKYRICREHLKSPVLVVEGIPSRFCQQCSRFHHVKEFDGPQRTCRGMLERLRIKRNSSKAQPGARNSGRGKDTRPADASGRGGSSSRSNSTGKDAEPHQDLASGQQPSPYRLAPTDSGEGGESAAVLTGAPTASRRSIAATSAATASSLPGSSHLLDQPHLQQLAQQQHHQDALQQRRSRPVEPLRAQDEPRESSISEYATRSAVAPPRGGGLADQQDLLQLFLSQDAALLPSRRNPVAAPGGAGGNQQHGGLRAAVASMAAAMRNRDVRMSGYDADRLEGAVAGGGSAAAMAAPLYTDSLYGGASGGNHPLSRDATVMQDLLPRRQGQAPPPAGVGVGAGAGPFHRNDREIRVQLGPGSLEESLLLQLAIPRAQHEARIAAPAAPPPSANVLDLGRPAAPPPMVLNLGSRVDLSLELQLQDIYREMAISDAAVAAQPAPPTLQQQQQQPSQHQVPLPRTGGGGSSGALFPRSHSTLSHEPLLPLGHHQGLSQTPAPQPPFPLAHQSLFASQHQQQQVTASAGGSALFPTSARAEAAGLSMRPALHAPGALDRAHSQGPANELAAAMRLGARMGGDRDTMELDRELANLSTSTSLLPPKRSAELPLAPAGTAGLLPQTASRVIPTAAAAGGDPWLQLQQPQNQPPMFHQPEPSSGVLGARAIQQHDGSRVPSSSEAAMSGPPGFGGLMTGSDGDGASAYGMSLFGGHRGAVTTMAAIPEAGDSWYGADDIDAALDMLMEESGSSAVYHSGNNTASLERVCFKLHNLHPRDLPPDLMGAMGSWLAAARAELVQGAVRTGCTELILDIYVSRHHPGGEDADVEPEPQGQGAAATTAAYTYTSLAKAAGDAPAGEAATTAADHGLKTPGSAGGKGRVLNCLLPSASELASLDAAAAAAGAEALQPISEMAVRSTGGSDTCQALPSDGAGGSGCSGTSTMQLGGTLHVSAHVMHHGNVRAAAAAFKKLLGPRAAQSMSVAIDHEVLTISSREMGSYVADVRGTVAGLDTPLLLSVTPLAIVAGVPSEIEVVGSHLAGPGRRPHVRCQGAHVSCALVQGPLGAFQKVRPYGSPSLVTQLLAATLPGSHRAGATANCTSVDLELQPPEAGLLMLEWEADRATGGIAISDWMPLVSVPSAAMAVEINKHVAGKEGNDTKLRGFLTDLGLVLDYVTRINQHALLPIALLIRCNGGAMDGGPGDHGADVGALANLGMGPSAASGGVGGAAEDFQGEVAWLNRSGGGGADQRMSALPDVAFDLSTLEHDSRTELMAKPRLSKKHYNRVAALTPTLLAFAADSGMPEVMSWLLDFMLEHVHFGDLAAAFSVVESVGAPAAGLPLLHRAVRSGNPRAVQLVQQRAASHGLACNLAQPMGPHLITPLHLAALQPFQSGMLQAFGCAEPAVAELWATVRDAAGRTPAMYLRRQLELSSRAVTLNKSVRVAAANPGVQDGPRSSTSGSTTAYRSWGSEDPVDVVRVGATNTGGPAASTDSTAESITDDGGGLVSLGPDAGRERISLMGGDSIGGSGAGMGGSTGTGNEVVRPPMSTDEDGERQQLAQRDQKVVARNAVMVAEAGAVMAPGTDLGAQGSTIRGGVSGSVAVAESLNLLTYLTGRDSAGRRGDGRTPSRPCLNVLHHSTMRSDMLQEEQLRHAGPAGPAAAVAAVTATATPAAVSEQGNGRAPLQVLSPMDCSGAERVGGLRSHPLSVGTARARMPVAARPETLEAALSPLGPTAPQETAKAKAREALGRVPYRDYAQQYGRGEAGKDDPSDSEEDWEKLRHVLRDRHRARAEQQHLEQEPREQQQGEKDACENRSSTEAVLKASGDAVASQPSSSLKANLCEAAACKEMGSTWRAARTLTAATNANAPRHVIMVVLVAAVALLVALALASRAPTAART